MSEKKTGGRLAGTGKTASRLIKYLFKHYGPHLVTVIICILLSGLASVVASLFLQKLIDECIIPALQTMSLESVWGRLLQIILTMGAIYAIGVFSSFLYTQLMAVVTQGTLKHMRDDMFDRMESLPIKYFDTNAHGDIMSTYTNDTDAIRQLIGQSLPMVVQSVISSVAIIFMMLHFSVWLTLIVVCFIFIMFVIIKNIGGASSKYMFEMQKSLAKEEGFIEEMMDGQKVIKVFCHEDASKKDFDKHNDQLFSDSDKAFKFGNIIPPILMNIGNLQYVITAIVGGLFVFGGVSNLSLGDGINLLTIGVIVSFLGMVRQLTQTINQASMQVSLIAMGLAGAKRVFALMDETPDEDDGYITLVNYELDDKGNYVDIDWNNHQWAWKEPLEDGTFKYTILKGNVRLENVDFSYTPDKQILHEISLYAKPGQKIAFVGATGAGKTTITNLLNRFYDIQNGTITYDGIDIKNIKKPALRRALGIVLQDVNLFTGTVMENIRFGNLQATDEACIAAAKLANAHDFITRLPDGYNTMLTGNGASLSQGQRQLISIARAAVANPAVMILDEATSSIDTRTEALVQDGMDKLMDGRTVFVIAHRLSTIRNSKAIMVMDHGRIIERGDHDELINQRGVYYQLYTGAFELE